MRLYNIIGACACALLTGLASCSGDNLHDDLATMPAEDVTLGPEVSENVYYEANPRLFGENDCLAGVSAQLPRIANMGCDVLWLMPVCEPGQLNSIGSPYCIRDFKAINPRYGSMQTMKDLVAQAHAKGMKVILDWIANHTAWDCAWITEHPDWYVHDADGAIVSPDGWNDVAQLDMSKAEVREAMTDAMQFWITNTGIDGFRCDYADGVPAEFWENAISRFRAADPGFIMLAETARPEFYNYGFDMIYDWNCPSAISAAFRDNKTDGVVTEAVTAFANVPDGKSILRFAFNHDVAAENSMSTMYGSAEGIPGAYLLAAMFKGTPMIYSSMDSDNIGGKLSFFDYRRLTFSTTLSDRYAAINRAFRRSAQVRRGSVADYSAPHVVCYLFSTPGHNLLVAVNTSGSEATVRTPIQVGRSVMTDLISDKEVNVPMELSLGPWQYMVLMN